MNHPDAYKMAIYCVRHVLGYISDQQIGNVELDSSLGNALNEMKPAAELMVDPTAAKLIAIACGAWKGVYTHEKYVERKVQEAIEQEALSHDAQRS
jgi:hypothetical protein